MTFAEFKAGIKARLFPEGIAETLDGLYDTVILDGMIELQRYVPCLAQEQTDVHPQGATYFRAGMTVVEMPPGEIRRVYTVRGEDYGSRIHYTQAPHGELELWSRGFMREVAAPLNAGLPALKFSYRYPEAGTDSLYGRALAGKWAVCGRRLFIAPWLQAEESLAVEWAGLKKSWAETDRLKTDDRDMFPWDEAAQRVLRLFCQHERPQDFPEGMKLAAKWRDDYLQARADLALDCRQIRHPWPEEAGGPEDGEEARYQELTGSGEAARAEARAEDETHATFAAFGDYGTDDEQEAAVAELVKGRDPGIIITTGDNLDGADDYDTAVGKHYGGYILPFKGDDTRNVSTAVENRFWPCLGEADEQAAYLDYFTLPNNGRYYDFRKGPMQVFVLNSSLSDAAAGYDYGSEMVKWFRRRVALSTLPWKVVVFHHAPYCSGEAGIAAVNGAAATHGAAHMRWPWDRLGIDLVLCGHEHMYERIDYQGRTTILNVGTGGHALSTTNWHADIVGGVDYRNGGFSYAPGVVSVCRPFAQTQRGAVFGKADCATLEVSFVTAEGVTVDTVTLRK